jgi:hypothetical protein
VRDAESDEQDSRDSTTCVMSRVAFTFTLVGRRDCMVRVSASRNRGDAVLRMRLACNQEGGYGRERPKE